jgi:SAM-dependent methyltransferase
MSDRNTQRFSGFADLYDSVRPSPPGELGALLSAYACTAGPAVVDLGSGSGLSSRWAARWAASVIGIEPNDDMRAVAESRPAAGLSYRRGTAQDTGLPSGSADLVLFVQALHWMDPVPTLREVSRILRPGGVMAAVDADWPPVAGSARAERAWLEVDRRIAVLERRMAAGDDLHRPVEEPPGAPGTTEVAQPSGASDRGAGVRSWDKAGHLERMAASGVFRFTREVVLHQAVDGGAERFVALLRSQGGYQELRRAGVSDDELGMPRFEHEVTAGLAQCSVPTPLSFSWRVRLGVAG